MSLMLELDFIERSPFSISRFTWLGLSVFFIGILFLFFIWQHYEAKLNASHDAELKLRGLNERALQAPAVKAVSADISPETKEQIEATVDALTIPWNALLVGIESADIQDVAILSLEPNRKKEQVILSGEAKNFQSVIQYINRLEDQIMLEKVYLQKHSIDETNISKPIRFTLIAQWHMAEVH